MSDNSVSDSITEIYSQREVLDFYTKLVGFGLYENETMMASFLRKGESLLVIGCGTGRETFALANNYKRTIGIDSCFSMIQRAKGFQTSLFSQKTKIDFLHESLESYLPNSTFNTIWITYGLTGHLLSKEERLTFLEGCRQLLSKDGQLVYFPEVAPERSKNLRRNFGGIFNFKKNFPYYFYPSLLEAKKEIKEVGFQAKISLDNGLILSLA